LPMYPELTVEEVGYVCDCIREFTESKLSIVGER
jgi:dTDP-4-amino-4,6-dideoxygalactose transaminase